MTYVITRSCCSDAACVPTCPVNCIHPAPGEPGFGTSEMLYIDPDTCIECSACVQVCPVNAIAHKDDLTPEALPFLELNAAFYRQGDGADLAEPRNPERREPARGLRVAIIGSGPAGSYAAAELLETVGTEVNVFEKLLTPYGLVRFGVAPDHQTTKAVGNSFPYDRKKDRLHPFFGVEIGKNLTHEELLLHHHAVIYAVGAPDDRAIGVSGEDLAGVHSAAEFVAWYNGHPEAAELEFDLSAERAVIIGNGNVALDIARVLAAPVAELEKTDIADHALEVLRSSKVREVLIVARRGPEHAAYSASEFIELTTRQDLSVRALPEEVGTGESFGEMDDPASSIRDIKVKRAIEVAGAAHSEDAGLRTITLRYGLTPKEFEGVGGVSQARFRRTAPQSNAAEDIEETIETSLVIRSVGFRGREIPGLPFDSAEAVVPNESGRVAGVAQTYVTGWIKRGPRGVIGTNRTCASETVGALLDDFHAGLLADPSGTQEELEKLVDSRGGVYGQASWAAIDTKEREAGRDSGRPRVKIAKQDHLLEIAKSARLSLTAD